MAEWKVCQYLISESEIRIAYEYYKFKKHFLFEFNFKSTALTVEKVQVNFKINYFKKLLKPNFINS